MYPTDPHGQAPRMAANPEETKGRRKRKGGGGRATKGRKDFKMPLIFALILGVAAFLLIMSAGSDPDARSGHVYAVRAAQDITAWTALTDVDVEAVLVDPTTLLPEDAFRDINEELYLADTPEEALAKLNLAEGVYTRYPVRIGQLLYKGDITTGSLIKQALENIEVTEGDRILSVPALPAAAAGGVIQPGDYVDLIVADASYELATILVENVPVLYVDLSEDALESMYSAQSQDPTLQPTDLKPADPFPGLYTLAIPAAHAEEVALFAHRNQATLVLSLRHRGEAVELDEQGMQPDQRIVSVIEALCPAHLLPGGLGGQPITPDFSVDPNAGLGEEVTPVELPKVCLAELVRLNEDVLRRTGGLEEPPSFTETPPTGGDAGSGE